MLNIILTVVSFIMYYMFSTYLLQYHTQENQSSEFVLVLSYMFLMCLFIIPIKSMINLMRKYNLM